MAMQTYEGTWEEIKQHEPNLIGHRLRVTVLDETSVDEDENFDVEQATVKPNYELLELLERTRQRQKDMPETSGEQTQEFLRQARDSRAYFSYILVGLIVVVTLFQLKTETVDSLFAVGEQSAEIAGLVKPSVWQGEYWRLLTYATLHGFFPLHLYFNAQALYGFGSLIEFLSNRAHLAIVFLSAIVGGGLLSLFFMPEVTSIGASGGIMGLIGYLAIYGYRRKRQLPPDFLKTMLINIGFIAAFGIIAYQIVDNFGHLGGFITGAIYGFVQIPKDLQKNPRSVGTITELLGYAALGVFIFTCLLSVLLLLRVVKL